MNGFDLTIIRFLTAYANQFPRFDVFVSVLSRLDLLKGASVMALFWWAWFRGGADEQRTRQVLLATMAGSAVALFLASGLALAFPFRLRPLLLVNTEGMQIDPTWKNWSAFPSDHAALFFALATGLYRADRRFGLLAFAHAVLVVSLPRLYIGLHYPTDILGGAILGIASAWASTTQNLRPVIARWPLAWLARHPASFYAAAFLTSYLIATLFADLRSIGLLLVSLRASR